VGDSDLLADLPSPPLGDLGDHLIDKMVTDAFAAELLSAGTLTAICHGDLADALDRAWLLYVQGHAITARLKEQQVIATTWQKEGRELAATGLATQPKARPKQYGDHALVQALWIIWKRYSPQTKGWVAYDGLNERPREGRFQRFVAEWLKKIDPERTAPPSRHVYRSVKLRLT
jgi:hypothetical protein